MVMKIQEIRNLNSDQVEARLQQYREELMDIRAQLSAGGSINDPGRVSEVKKTIARLLTVQREEELGINQ